MSTNRDYEDDSNNIFEEYASKELFDEEDEEIGFDNHVVGDGFDSSGYSHKKPQPNPEEKHLHISGPEFKISATKPLPSTFKNSGVVKALLFMKNGKVVLLK